jgi:TrmH family RNA methyltransferase
MITSLSNPRVKQIRALQNRRKARLKAGAFVAEGVRMAQEVIAAEQSVQLVLHTDDLEPTGRGLIPSLRELGAEVFAVSDSVMAACSSTESPPGLLLVLPLPNTAAPPAPTLALVLDRIADPGNLGTIIRTARAARVERIYLTPGSVDPFNPKVVRAGMGAQLHIPIQTLPLDQIELDLQGLDLWLAESTGGTPYHQVDWRRSCALVVGSEAHGPQDKLRARVPQRVHIPMPGQQESLNAAIATAVLLFEITRQRGAL